MSSRRDYFQLSESEFADWERVEREQRSHDDRLLTRASSDFDLPKAVRHYRSLLPNAYLDPADLEGDLDERLMSFAELLDSPNCTERSILRFLKDRSAHFLVGALLHSHFSFGHHGAFALAEFPLGTTHRCDFLLVGGSSDGWSFVFVELEAPSGRITRASGTPGEALRKGVLQVEAWNRWLQANYSALRPIFEKHSRPSVRRKRDGTLPPEFVSLDCSRLHYVVVAGRRKDFDDTTYRTRREQQAAQVLLLHYDNMLDAARSLLSERRTY